ncbi:adenosine deaminase [Hoeflea poritis]|uniref:Adenosine deaminase n=1 Tax=Hoeflea poritis TaxID=2993659 RepID=A0ABT4VR40_9HYPH|nr:adenosine deaminase [Hoeflea poritis]MDA4847168.1 adenosine deaminase [Hoeflea poritis]
MTELHEFFRTVPKPELHLHLHGAVEPETLIDLAKKNGVPLPEGDVRETLYARKSGGEVQSILPTLKIICRSMVARDDFARVAYDIQKSAANCGVRYREIFWNPTDHATIAGVSYETAVDGLIDGMAAAETDFGIVGRLIPSIDREGTPEAAFEMVEWVAEHPRDAVIGLGMDYLETGHPPEKFWKSYRLASKHGLRRTAHAGEFLEPARNVETCLDLLGCERIDHGYTITDAPDLAARCIDAGIPFSVVPTNTTYIKTLAGAAFRNEHPIRKMGDLGLRIFPNSDDPPLHHTDPARAYADMITEFGFTLADTRKFLGNAIDAAWVDDATRRDWKRDWLAEFDLQAARLQSHSKNGNEHG